MSNARNRRDRRRPRSRSISPQLFSQNKRDLRNDLRNNLRFRSRSRSPRMMDELFREQQYSPTDNFRGNRHAIEDEERFYLEQQQREEHFFQQERAQRSPEIEMRHQPNRRNFRSKSREFYDEAHQLNFEPNSRNTRFSPPDPRNQILNDAIDMYHNEIVESGPIVYSKNQNINPFANTLVSEQPKLTPSDISWQPPPDEVILIADPEPEPEIIIERQVEPPEEITIPFFDPENEAFNSRQFIEKLDELGKIHKWNEDELKFNFVTHLEGNAKSWQINSNRMLNPWNNIKRTFVNTFPPQMDFHKKLKDMMSRQMTQHETLKTYIMHKTILLNQVEVFGRRAVSCIISGLLNTDEVKEAAYSKNFGTPEDLLTYLAAVENEAKEKEAKEKSAKKMQEAAAQAAAQASVIPPLLSEASILQAQQIAKQRLQLNICYNCMREGHTSKDCPSLQPARRQILPKHCIEVSINGITFQGYNDLSSNCVAMRESDAKKANIQFQRHITCIRGFGNASVTALGEARVIIRVDKVMLSFEIAIVPNAAQDMAVVIGRNFRNHPDVRYVEAEMGISFTQIPQAIGSAGGNMQQNSSFSANERLMASFNSSGGGNNRNNNSNRQMDKGRRRF